MSEQRTTEVNIVTGPKGGIGKSAIAAFLAQYLNHCGQQAICFDVDAANSTLAKIKALGAAPVPLLVKGEVSPAMFDGMMETIAINDGPFVLDIGSSVYFPFWNYVTHNQIFEVLHEIPRRVVIHVPLAGGSSTEETVKALGDICRVAPAKSVVAWLNQRIEPIVLNGHMPDKELFGMITTEAQLYPLHAEAVERMLTQGLTFDEAAAQLGMFPGNRIRIVRDEIYQKLREIGV